MHKYGLKLWSTNYAYAADAIRLFEEGVYQYIELFVIPNSYDRWIGLWQKKRDEKGIPFVIHAPHWREGVNLAKKENEKQNIELIGQAQRFAEKLNADKIIIHPGIAGDIKETARQLNNIRDYRIVIENKPYYALDDGLFCNGSMPEEIKYVINESGTRFCFDFGHAISAANGHNIMPEKFIEEFLKLNPNIFHMSDGYRESVYDRHEHIDEGNFDINWILSKIPEGSMITVETKKNSKTDLSDYRRDIEKIINIYNK